MCTEWHANVQIMWNYFFESVHKTVDQFVCLQCFCILHFRRSMNTVLIITIQEIILYALYIYIYISIYILELSQLTR